MDQCALAQPSRIFLTNMRFAVPGQIDNSLFLYPPVDDCVNLFNLAASRSVAQEWARAFFDSEERIGPLALDDSDEPNVLRLELSPYNPLTGVSTSTIHMIWTYDS